MSIDLDKLALDGNIEGDAIVTTNNNNTPADSTSTSTKPEDIVEEIADITDDTVVDNEDSVELAQNDNGDIVDATGKVLIKKADIKLDDNGDVIFPEDLEVTDNSIIGNISKTLEQELGFSLVGDDGAPIEFTNDAAGITKLVKTAAGKLQEAQEAEFFEAYPALVNIVKHLNTGKDINSYFDVSSQYRKTEIPAETDKNKETLKVIRRNLIVDKEIAIRSRGQQLTPEQLTKVRNEANDYAEYVFSTARETDAANEALAQLREFEIANERARDSQNDRILLEREEAANKYWTSVQETVTKGALGNITIPQKDRDAFYKYVAADANGKRQTQEMLDIQQEDIALRLQLSYLRFKKFDIKSLVDSQVKVEQQKSLNEMLEANNTRKRFHLKGSSNTSNKSGGSKDITLDNMLGGII